MKILSVRLQNLNSLRGEWLIDFRQPPFSQTNIFAITGATGAGKTTILDAICLALYHQTPRLKTSPTSSPICVRSCAAVSCQRTPSSLRGLYCPPGIPGRTGRTSSAKGAARMATRACRPPDRPARARAGSQISPISVMSFAFHLGLNTPGGPGGWPPGFPADHARTRSDFASYIGTSEATASWRWPATSIS